LRLYDPGAAAPILLKPGDRVRFRRIDRREFDQISAAVEARVFRPVIA
jgi:allophanate hydrolase subunit 1